jgi:hypothetical protein
VNKNLDTVIKANTRVWERIVVPDWEVRCGPAEVCAMIERGAGQTKLLSLG